MNAGGVPNTCKSNAYIGAILGASGRRVSNAWIIYLRMGNILPKGRAIPHNMARASALAIKAGDWETGLAFGEEFALD
jgi:hypothetical protein